MWALRERRQNMEPVSREDKVDLYYNDVYACKKSLELCERYNGYSNRPPI